MNRVASQTESQDTSSQLVSSGLLQRTCNCGTHAASAECDDCQKTQKGRLQRSPVSSGRTNFVPSLVHEVLRSPGQPLDHATRAFFEPRFGHDFSHTPVSSVPASSRQNKLEVGAPDTK